jgi:hypothetical protein
MTKSKAHADKAAASRKADRGAVINDEREAERAHQQRIVHDEATVASAADAPPVALPADVAADPVRAHVKTAAQEAKIAKRDAAAAAKAAADAAAATPAGQLAAALDQLDRAYPILAVLTLPAEVRVVLMRARDCALMKEPHA